MADPSDEIRTLRHRLKDLEETFWRLRREPFAPEVGLQRAVVTTAIPAAPSTSTVSDAGRATLQSRDGTDIVAGVTGQVIYSDFATEIPVGTRILIAPDGDGWILVSGDCP